MKKKTNEELFIEYNKTHSQEIRDQIILQNANLVKIIANRMYIKLGGSVNVEDLCSYGIIGLIEVVDRFDLSLGIKFETYATTRIRGAMLDEIRNLDWVPRTIRSMDKSIKEYSTEYKEKNNGVEPSEEQIAEHLGVPVKKIYEHQSLMVRSNVYSLENLNDSGNKSDHADVDYADLISGNSPTPEHLFLINDDVPNILKNAIEKLTEKEQLALQLIYYEELTFKEAANVIGVTESRVSQLHAKALIKLREYLGNDKELMAVFCI